MSGVMLAHIVLHKLSEKPLSGYSLVKEIEESTGKKPSYGSIYPILERMTKQDLVTVKAEGRKKVYTLSAKGRAAAADLKNHHHHIIDQIINQSKIFCAVTGNDPEPMLAMLERLKKGDDPLKGISANALKLRDTLFKLSHENKIKNHQKEINAILEDAIMRLEHI